MKHKIIIDVGSTVQWVECSPVLTVERIDYKDKTIEYKECSNRDYFESYDMKVYKYNGIPISEIESVEIAQPKNFAHVKVGQWVRSLVDNHNRKKDTWYQRVDNNTLSDDCFCYAILNNESMWSEDTHTWDLLDIRDENPNKPIGDKQMYEPITKDNIVEVLKFNNISDWEVNGNQIENNNMMFLFTNPNWLQHLEVETGKLNPLPKFDFKQHLLDNGFVQGNHPLYIRNNINVEIVISECGSEFHHWGYNKLYKCDKTNADILIAMDKLSEGLNAQTKIKLFRIVVKIKNINRMMFSRYIIDTLAKYAETATWYVLRIIQTIIAGIVTLPLVIPMLIMVEIIRNWEKTLNKRNARRFRELIRNGK